MITETAQMSAGMTALFQRAGMLVDPLDLNIKAYQKCTDKSIISDS